MFYFWLPYPYTEYKFNNFLNNYIKNHPDRINFNCVIEMTYGNFPFCFWGGDENNNTQSSNIVMRKTALEFASEIEIPMCIDIGNTLLTSADKYDKHLQMVLEAFAYRGNYIRIGNQEFLEYIDAKHFGYQFIWSSDQFDDILCDKVTYAELPSHYNNILLTHHMDYNPQLVLTLGNPCQQCPIETYKYCRQQENNYQINFSVNSILKTCDKRKPENLSRELEKLKNLGYIRYKIAPTDENELIKFFIKPEYQDNFYKEYNQTLYD